MKNKESIKFETKMVKAQQLCIIKKLTNHFHIRNSCSGIRSKPLDVVGVSPPFSLQLSLLLPGSLCDANHSAPVSLHLARPGPRKTLDDNSILAPALFRRRRHPPAPAEYFVVGPRFGTRHLRGVLQWVRRCRIQRRSVITRPTAIFGRKMSL